MENAVLATQILSNLGMLLLGIGVVWIATKYKGLKE